MNISVLEALQTLPCTATSQCVGIENKGMGGQKITGIMAAPIAAAGSSDLSKAFEAAIRLGDKVPAQTAITPGDIVKAIQQSLEKLVPETTQLAFKKVTENSLLTTNAPNDRGPSNGSSRT